MRACDFHQESNISATTAAFGLEGGLYAMSVVGANYGTVKLQMLGFDGSTYVDLKQPFDKPDGTGGTEEDLVIGSFGANGMKCFNLPAGQYKITISSTTGVYVSIVRVPGD